VDSFSSPFDVWCFDAYERGGKRGEKLGQVPRSEEEKGGEEGGKTQGSKTASTFSIAPELGRGTKRGEEGGKEKGGRT